MICQKNNQNLQIPQKWQKVYKYRKPIEIVQTLKEKNDKQKTKLPAMELATLRSRFS